MTKLVLPAGAKVMWLLGHGLGQGHMPVPLTLCPHSLQGLELSETSLALTPTEVRVLKPLRIRVLHHTQRNPKPNKYKDWSHFFH